MDFPHQKNTKFVSKKNTMCFLREGRGYHPKMSVPSLVLHRYSTEWGSPEICKGKQRYDRFASIAACKTMDPEMEFELKYEGIDDALQMARKAHQKFEKSIFEEPSFTVKLMGVGILQMSSFKSAWVALMELRCVTFPLFPFLKNNDVGWNFKQICSAQSLQSS